MSGIKANKLEPAQAQQILTEVKSRLQLSLQSPTYLLPGQPLLASIIPNVPHLDISELVNGVLNLAWLEKDVLYKDVKAVAIPSPETTPDAGNFDGDEILSDLQQDPLAVIKQPFPLPLLGSAVVPQTPGLAAQLAGTITLPKLSVNIKTEWIIRDRSGNQLTSEDNQLVALNGTTSPSVSVLLPPVFRELRRDTLTNPGGTIFCLSVNITLSIDNAVLSFSLGPIPVVQLPVLVPTVVAMFSEPNFNVTDQSAALLWVPRHSLFSSAAPLFKELKKIEAVLDTLSSIAGIAGFLLGVKELTSLTDHPRLRFMAEDGIPNLSEIKLKRKPWYDILGSDLTFNDQTSSLLVFGLPGTKVQFFNRNKFEKDDGYYEIKLKTAADLAADPNELLSLPDFFVAIRSFPTGTQRQMDTSLNSAPPETFPVNRISDHFDDPGSNNIWDERLSSVRFTPSWLEEVTTDIKNPQLVGELICAKPRNPKPKPGTKS